MQTIYLYDDGMTITKQGERINVLMGKEILISEPIINLSDIVLMGNIQITEQALKLLITNNISITHATKSGQIYAFTNTMQSERCTLRLIQYECFLNYEFRLSLAKTFCRKKVNEQKNYLLSEKRRISKEYITNINKTLVRLDKCKTIDEVMGIEGQIAKLYFSALSEISMFKERTRRPPKDIFNSLLSLTYMMLEHKINMILFSKKLDTSIGFLHTINDGRASLSFDFLELFRSKADKFVILITNRKEFTKNDFEVDSETKGVYLNKDGFKKYIEKYNIDIDSELKKQCDLFIKAIKNKDVKIFAEV